MFTEALRKAAPLYVARLESGHLDLDSVSVSETETETGLGYELLAVKMVAQDYARAQVRLLEGVCARLLGLGHEQKHGAHATSDFYLTPNVAPETLDLSDALKSTLRLQAQRYLEKRIMIASMERDPAKLDAHYEIIMGHCRPTNAGLRSDSAIYRDMLIYMFYDREQRVVGQMAASGV